MQNRYYFWVCTRCGKRVISSHRPDPGICNNPANLTDLFDPKSQYNKRKSHPPHRWVKDGLASEEDYQKFKIEEQRSNNVTLFVYLIIVLIIVAYSVINSQRFSNKVNNSTPSTVVERESEHSAVQRADDSIVMERESEHSAIQRADDSIVVKRESEHSAVQSTDGDSIVDKTNETVNLQQSTETDKTVGIESYGGKAVELIKAKKFDAGIQLAEKYLATYSNDYDVNFYLGYAYAEKNKNELAERYYLKAVQLEHQRAFAWFNLAVVQSRNGNYKKSARSFVQFYKLANYKKIALSKIRKIADKKSPESKGAIEALKILKL